MGAEWTQRVALSRWGAAVVLVLMVAAVARAATLDQPVSLELSGGTLGAALEELSRQTGFHFDIDPRWADEPVTLKVQNISLRECLQRLLKNLNYAIVLENAQRVAVNIFGERGAPPALPAGRPEPLPPPVIPPEELEEAELPEDEEVAQEEPGEPDGEPREPEEAPPAEGEPPGEEGEGDETQDGPGEDAPAEEGEPQEAAPPEELNPQQG